MKMLGGLLAVLVVAVAFFTPKTVDAAACANVSSFGAVTLALPKLPVQEDRVIWVRLQALTPADTVLVQVNNDECLQVGGFAQAPGQWTWQTYRLGEAIQTVDFPNETQNRLKVIGTSDGVRIDRVVVTGRDCVPQDFGANCQQVEAVQDVGDDAIIQLPSPSNDAVQGEILLSSTPDKYKSQLASVAYIVDGQTVQESSTPRPFDTTRIANGKHTVQVVTTLKDGKTIRESAVIVVANAENILTPLVRWLRLYLDTIVRVGAAMGMLLLVFLAAKLYRRTRLKRRERRFHGF